MCNLALSSFSSNIGTTISSGPRSMVVSVLKIVRYFLSTIIARAYWDLFWSIFREHGSKVINFDSNPSESLVCTRSKIFSASGSFLYVRRMHITRTRLYVEKNCLSSMVSNGLVSVKPTKNGFMNSLSFRAILSGPELISFIDKSSCVIPKSISFDSIVVVIGYNICYCLYSI
ncbi:MAG: hypothetical protein Hyperionvirus20_20 [Hyperionvirus sp.]|uniref:Uncharacterized protein n=1 Tax=Hyperionvirus sp. TaxID=2487770 RepID=A0A3G5AAV1_9VIRU|nr:MAG: hypothetical protein Hyperionvirus20_20 [Hyperionvirus sp.]